MALILTIDMLADRYKMLPHQILDQANTFDLYIMDAALTYYNYQQKKSSGNVQDIYDTEDLEMIMKKAKGYGG
jgi:hypothetical protein